MDARSSWRWLGRVGRLRPQIQGNRLLNAPGRSKKMQRTFKTAEGRHLVRHQPKMIMKFFRQFTQQFSKPHGQAVQFGFNDIAGHGFGEIADANGRALRERV